MTASGSDEWVQLWKEYSKSLENWNSVVDNAKNASQDMQKKFLTVMEKAAKESSAETIRQFGENWQKAMNDAGLKSVQEFNQYWQKAMGQPGMEFQEFAVSWQKAISDQGLMQMKAYGDMMGKFAETWNSMWPQK